MRWLRKTGRLSAIQWARIMRWVAQYMSGMIDFPHMMARLTAQTAGADEAEAWAMCAEWFETMLRGYIAQGARERVAWHQAQGHHTAIVSAATPYVVKFVARDLGMGDAYLATQLRIARGRFTGEVAEPACYGMGKVTMAKAYAEEHDLDLSQSYFYSDSDHDMPLLAAVGHPVAVNPNYRLARIAAQRGWPVLRFY